MLISLTKNLNRFFRNEIIIQNRCTKFKKMREKKKDYKNLIIFLALLLIISLWAGSWFLIDKLYPISDNSSIDYIAQRGAFGDKFGFINSLFSGLALTGIIVSIYLQSIELSLQKKELKKTREEFEINRLTNILFKQVEYANYLIDNHKIGNFDINRFLEIIKQYNDDKDYASIDSMYNDSQNDIKKLLLELKEKLQYFEGFLSKQDIEEKEVSSILKLFRVNLKPSLISLLGAYRGWFFSKYELDATYDDLEMIVIEEERKLIDYIIKYGI